MVKSKVVFNHMATPWGRADYVEEIQPFLGVVGTAGHGGVKVSEEYNNKIPESVRNQSGWYEEDCEWCIPYLFLREFLFDKQYPEAHDCFKNWYWKQYEEIFETILSPEESFLKAEYIWKSQNAGKWHIICAQRLENGDVKLTLTVDGKREGFISKFEEKEVVMSKEDYKRSLSFGNKAAFTDEELIILRKY